MLTMKGKDGLKAMVHLARLPAQELAAGLDISEANRIPSKFLDAILARLREAALVEAKKGKGGGYRLAKPATKIMVGDIVRALDGPLAPILMARSHRLPALRRLPRSQQTLRGQARHDRGARRHRRRAGQEVARGHVRGPSRRATPAADRDRALKGRKNGISPANGGMSSITLQDE